MLKIPKLNEATATKPHAVTLMFYAVASSVFNFFKKRKESHICMRENLENANAKLAGKHCEKELLLYQKLLTT